MSLANKSRANKQTKSGEPHRVSLANKLVKNNKKKVGSKMNITVKVLDRKAPSPSFLRNVEFDSMESAEAYAAEFTNSQFWSVIEVR